MKGEPFAFTIVNVLGSILPFLIVYLVIYFSGNDQVQFLDLIDNGQLTITCVALSSGVIYSTFKNKNFEKSPVILDWIFWITILFVIVGVIIYMVSISDSNFIDVLIENNDNKLNSEKTDYKLRGKNRVAIWSYIFLAYTCLVLYISRLLDLRNYDMPEERGRTLSSLENKIKNNG